MCSSAQKEISQTDQALQKSQAAMTDTLNKDYSVTFAQQQSVLGQMKARMEYMAANPMGYTPAELHSATTSINENTARAAQNALGKAAAFAAAHGSADIGGGATGQLAGELLSEASQSKAQALSSLTQQNEAMKRSNFWNAISGLNSVGSEYGGQSGTAIGGATSTAGSAVNAGHGALEAAQASWGNTFGLMKGIAGLGMAAATPFAPALAPVAAANAQGG